jgi:hypothetical protein
MQQQLWIRTSLKVLKNKATRVTELFNYELLLSPALILCLFMGKAHVCIPKMADGLSDYFASCPGM